MTNSLVPSGSRARLALPLNLADHNCRQVQVVKSEMRGAHKEGRTRSQRTTGGSHGAMACRISDGSGRDALVAFVQEKVAASYLSDGLFFWLRQLRMDRL
jgi:hypothetical protein